MTKENTLPTMVGKEEKLVTTKQLADVLGVSERTVQRTIEKLTTVLSPLSTNSQGGYLFNEEQATLIKQEIQGHHNLQSRQIDNVTTDAEMELLTQKVMQYHIQKAQYLQQQLNQLEAQNNQLAIEAKESKEETERIYQLEKDFHSVTYTPTQIAKALGISAKMVGKIARAIGLVITDAHGITVPAIGRTDVITEQRLCNDGVYRPGVQYKEQAKNLIEAYYYGNKGRL